MGLETAHPDALERLHKRMTVDGFRLAADELRALGVALRVFLLVSPPFVPHAEQDDWLLRSIDVALAAGASAISLIPTRTGNGALEALADQGLVSPADAVGPRAKPGARSYTRFRQRRAHLRRSLESGSIRRLRALPGRPSRTTARDEPRTARAAAASLPPVPGTARRMTLSVDVDVAIVGSGFAGALCALALRQRGQRVALIERGRHPRFAIGESTTPLTNLLLEELADRYDLPQIRSFSKWGTWQQAHPDVACGLKRGFTFLFHRLDERFADDEDHARQLLVAASPNDDVADTHWYRPDFDLTLVEHAQAAGATYLDETRLDTIRDTGTGMRLEWHAPGPYRRGHRRLRDRRQRTARIPDERARDRQRALAVVAANARAYSHTSRGSISGRTWRRPTAVRRILPTRQPSTTCSLAAGSGCCDSTTASRAPARR